MTATSLPQTTADQDPALELSSEQLFGGRNEVVITHRGSAYRLRITRQDKLILTK